MLREYFVYLLASKRNGTLYIGITNDLTRRTLEHKHGLVPGFTKKYGVNILVYFESFDRIEDAIAREKQLKGWNRAWKIRLTGQLGLERFVWLVPLCHPRRVSRATRVKRGKGTQVDRHLNQLIHLGSLPLASLGRE